MSFIFPQTAADRDQWILDRRPARASVSTHKPYACLVENECGPDGQVAPVATIFLTNRECPFRCTMCDLWRNTLTESVPAGAIPAQIDHALRQLDPARVVKLYNSGSFFDPRAIPPQDYAPIVDRIQHFDRVIVECHPAFVNDRCLEFRDLLSGRLEIAIGLETANPETLEKLNKRMTLQQFQQAASFLHRHNIDLRVFILVQPPFMQPGDAVHWAQRSLDFAFDCGATAATLIPTRAGNGAMESLAVSGDFTPPRMSTLEDAADYGLAQHRGRVFTDLWDLQLNGECNHCFSRRLQRLRKMNLSQSLIPRVTCHRCGNQSSEEF